MSLGLPKYEVIIPAYNAADTLEAAVASINNQTHPPTRILIIDDGSTDQTAAIAETLPGVELIRQANSGSASATNAGLALMSTDFVAFLDADDVWLEQKAQHQIEHLLQHPQFAGSCTHGAVFRGGLADPEFTREIEFWGRSSLLMHSGVARQIGLMLLHMPGGIGEVVDWIARGRDLGLKFYMHPEVLAWRRIRRGSQSYFLDETKLRGYLAAAKMALARKRGLSAQ